MYYPLLRRKKRLSILSYLIVGPRPVRNKMYDNASQLKHDI